MLFSCVRSKFFELDSVLLFFEIHFEQIIFPEEAHLPIELMKVKITCMSGLSVSV